MLTVRSMKVISRNPPNLRQTFTICDPIHQLLAADFSVLQHHDALPDTIQAIGQDLRLVRLEAAVIEPGSDLPIPLGSELCVLRVGSANLSLPYSSQPNQGLF